MDNPARPAVALIGGGKISTKLPVLSQLAKLCDSILVGGGIANTFLVASGCPVGSSLIEADMISSASQMLNDYPDRFVLPVDVRVATEINDDAKTRIIKTSRLSEIGAEEKITDIGPESEVMQSEIIHKAGTVIWNGPAGIFELAPFANGTAAWAKAAAETSAYTLAGGGDTLAAVAKFNINEKLSYLSTGGGALLEALAGVELPAIAALVEATGG